MSQAQAPTGWELLVRPITPLDESALVRFHSRLSSESIRRRFFTAHPRLTDKEVEHFTSVDHHRREAFVAEVGGELVAVGRFDRLDESTDAEVAFVVADGWHDRGIATELLRRLAARAREEGIRRLVAETLPDNGPMLAVFAHSGMQTECALDHGVVHVVMDLSVGAQPISPSTRPEGTDQVNTDPPSGAAASSA
jgi:RimJ/RimL family protein N-acetyltransferase